MSGLHIRFATKEDAGLIADLSRQTFMETFATQNSKENMDKFMNGPFNREKLVSEVGALGNIFLLAFKGEEPVGYVRLRDFVNPPGLAGVKAIELARIYATKNAIGSGVGRALMEKCFSIAAEMNRDIIWLGVWEKNIKAIDFYTKRGFEKFGTHVFMLGDDPQTDWLLKKQILK